MRKLLLTSTFGKVGGRSAGDYSVEAQEYGMPLTANKTTKAFTSNAITNLRAAPALLERKDGNKKILRRFGEPGASNRPAALYYSFTTVRKSQLLFHRQVCLAVFAGAAAAGRAAAGVPHIWLQLCSCSCPGSPRHS